MQTAETAFVPEKWAPEDFDAAPDPMAAGMELANRLSAENAAALREVASLRAVNADLLAALKGVVKALDGRVHSRPALTALGAAREAIAKAEGR